MLEEFMVGIYDLMTGSLIASLFGCFLWGLVSVLVSPCHLAAIPMVLSYAAMQEEELTPARGARYAVAFCVGLVCTVSALGAICALLGRMLGGVPEWTEALAGAVMVLLALSLWRGHSCCSDHLSSSGEDSCCGGSSLARFGLQGIWGALALGLLFGVVSGACVYGFLAPVLAVIFAEGRVLDGAAMTACFAIGHCLPIAFAGAAAGRVRAMFQRRHRALNLVACAVIGLIGAYFIWHGLSHSHVHIF